MFLFTQRKTFKETNQQQNDEIKSRLLNQSQACMSLFITVLVYLDFFIFISSFSILHPNYTKNFNPTALIFL